MTGGWWRISRRRHLTRTSKTTAIDPIRREMVPQVARAAEDTVVQFPGVMVARISQRFGTTFSVSVTRARAFSPPSSGADRFHLTFTGTGFTGINDRFATAGVQGELVSRHLAFLPAAALAPPVGVAGLRASLRRPHHGELSIDLTDPVSGGRGHCAGAVCVLRSTAQNDRIH